MSANSPAVPHIDFDSESLKLRLKMEFPADMARLSEVVDSIMQVVSAMECACGHEGPTVGTEIVRYSDLPGGDKITCAGTIDAYVRGAA